MDTADIPRRSPQPWVPESDLETVALLGKTVEECGELIAVLGRCIIQGVRESDPETGKLNVLKVQDEIADVTALVAMLGRKIGTDSNEQLTRSIRKSGFLGEWLKTLKGRRR
jgi:NTP pyrophosphatase (non-canonical NTP hydrolase)